MSTITGRSAASPHESLLASEQPPAPTRTRFAAFAIGFGLLAAIVVYSLLIPAGGLPAFVLLASLLLTLSSLAAMLVFRQMQLPLEAAQRLVEAQAQQLQAMVDQAPEPLVAVAEPVAVTPAAERESLRADAASQRRLRAELIADRAEPVLLVAQDGRIDAVNAAAAALVSQSVAALSRQPLGDSFPLYDNRQQEPLQHRLDAAMRQLWTDGLDDGQTFSALLERRGWTSVPMRLHCRLIGDAQQGPRLLLISMQIEPAAAAQRSFAYANDVFLEGQTAIAERLQLNVQDFDLALPGVDEQTQRI